MESIDHALDNELIQRARRGEAEAFGLLTKPYFPGIFRISRRILKNHEDAEDNVQNALCRAYANLRQFRGTARFSTWLTRIAINQALMALRRVSSRRAARARAGLAESSDPLPEHVPSRQPTPERDFMNKELAQRMCSSLPSLLRDPFVLYSVEGWTHRELAHIFGVRPQTIKRRILRARMELKKQLGSGLVPSNGQPH